jgi:hypothetical protein
MTQHSVTTLEELVAFIASHRHYAETRWTMWDRIEMVYDSKEAYEAWTPMWDAANDAYGTPDYDRLIKEAEAQRPPRHRETTYGLQEANRNHSTSWTRSDYISLSMELGDMINDVWTKKTGRYGNYQERTGCLTIPGMLKRLGNTTVKQQIQEAEARQQANDARNRRNYARRELKRLATEARKQLDLLGLDCDVTIARLLAIADEE